MSKIAAHVKLLKSAYDLMEKELEGEYFPSYRKVKRWEGKAGPDSFHKPPSVRRKGWARYNHMNAGDFPKVMEKVEKWYGKLVVCLRKEKGGGKAAAWLTHFVVDALEPMHLISLKGRKWRHMQIEKKTKDVEILSEKVRVERVKEREADTRVRPYGLSEYLRIKEEKIKGLKIWEMGEIEEIREVYREKVRLLQVEAVVSCWRMALREAGEEL